MDLNTYMNKLDFSECMRTGNDTIITFLWQKGLEDKTSFACDINTETKEFTLKYMSGPTVLTLGPASHYDNEAHLRNMCNAFYKRVKALSVLN